MTVQVVALSLSGVVLLMLAYCMFRWLGPLSEWNRCRQIRWLDRYSLAVPPPESTSRRPLNGFLAAVVQTPVSVLGFVWRSPRYHRSLVAFVGLFFGLFGLLFLLGVIIGR